MRSLLLAASLLPACGRNIDGTPPTEDPTAAYAALLAKAVTPEGLVNYEVIRADDGPLRDFVGGLAAAPLPADRDAALARGIDAYNAWVLLGVLEHWPLDSVRDLRIGPLESHGAHFFLRLRFSLGGERVSLKGFEDEVIRARFQDPRIHGAINCASAGCPPLDARLFGGSDLNARLDEAMSRFVATRVSLDGETVVFNEIFDWFEDDFIDWTDAADLCAYVARYDPAYAAAAAAGCPHRFIPYDWALNAAP